MNIEIKKRIEQINKKNVPNSYKKVGMAIIPKNWDITSLIEISEKGISNGIFNAPNKVGNGVKLINVVNLYEEPYIKLDNLSLLEVTADELECYRVKKGDIFFTRSSLKLEGIAHCNINLFDEIDMVFDCHIMKISPNKEKFDPLFLRLFFLSSYARKYFIAHAKTTTMTTIGQKDIEKMPIYYPSLSEQQKIANILSTCDKLIELKEKLIEKKKFQKKYLMQALLDPKSPNFRRLTGFKGEWKEIKLGSLGKTYGGLSGKNKNDFGAGKPYIPYINIFNNPIININSFEYVAIGENENQNQVKSGDVFFTTSSETPEEVGMSSVILENTNELYLNSFCFGFRLYEFNKLNPNFAVYFFRSKFFRKILNKLSQGSTRFNLSKNSMMKVNIILPAIKEQKAIANILSVVDKEINLLEKELEQQKLKKKALMQLLLTGKVRVNVS